MDDVKKTYKRYLDLINDYLPDYLPKIDEKSHSLYEAIRY